MHKVLSLIVLASTAILLVFTTGCIDRKAAQANTGGDASSSKAEETGTTQHAPITHEELQKLRYNFHRVNFDFDSAQLEGKSRQVLAANAEILMRHPNVTVQVEGHADHWGSDVYNLALGQRRAESVRRFLTSYGVATGQLAVISYGEERPLVGDAARSEEAPNRRAEFLVTVGTETITSSY